MTAHVPQLFNSASLNSVPEFINNDAWAFEQKVDGMRCMSVIEDGNIEFITRGGKPLKSSAAKKHFDMARDALQPFVEMTREFGRCVFDGEIVPEASTLVLLDIPEILTQKLSLRPSAPLSVRRTMLAHMGGYVRSSGVTVVKHASTQHEKQKLFDEVVEMNLEGVIAKRLDSPYSYGNRVSHSLKIKLTDTADVIVTGKNSGESRHSKRGGDKINYEFGVWDHEGDVTQVVRVGNCSGIGKANAEIGDVIEVEYLYKGAGGRLVQPRMLRVRKDKSGLDCSMGQFRDYSKTVL